MEVGASPGSVRSPALDCALPMEALAETSAIARAAEDIGFGGMWANDTQHNPFVALAVAAQATARLELGTGIAVAFARSPMVTAQTSWDLSRLSGGRFLLGLGTQVRAHIERRFGMPWDPPIAKLREYIHAVRAIWRTWQDGVPLRISGTYYNINLMGPFFSPGPNAQPRIPILIAGVNAGLCRLAGEAADGFIVHPMHSVAYLRNFVLPRVAEGAARAGRRREEVAIVAPVMIAAGDTSEEVAAAVERARARIAFYGSTPSYRLLLEALGHGELADRLRQLVAARRMNEIAPLVPDDVLDAVIVRGSYAEVGRELRARYAGLADRVFSYWPFTVAERACWARMAEAFREAG